MSAAARDNASGPAARRAGRRATPLEDLGPAAGDDVDLELLEAREAEPVRRLRPRWSTRGPRTGLAVMTLVAALLGASVGALVTQRHASAVARDERAVLAVQAGLPSLVRGADPGTADARGLSPVVLAVPLTNRGQQAVTITVLGLDTPHQRLAQPAPPVALDGGVTVPALVALDVDCARQLSVPPERAPAPGEVRVRLDLATGPREVAMPIVEVPRMGVSSLLTDACSPAEQRPPAQSARWSPRSDGRLVVTVSNVLRTTSVDVDLRETPGLGVLSDPPLPLTVPALGVGEVTLTLEPDCAVVGSTVSGTSSGTFDLVAVADGVVQTLLPDDEASGREVWLSRQLALRCG